MSDDSKRLASDIQSPDQGGDSDVSHLADWSGNAHYFLSRLKSRKGVAIVLAFVGSLILLILLALEYLWLLLPYDSDIYYYFRDLERSVNTTPLLVVGSLLVGTGGILLFNPAATAENAMRREVERDSLSYGSVAVTGSVRGDVNISYPEGYNPAQAILAEQLSKSSAGLRQQESILREIYTQGLAQARLSFNVSMMFAGIGGSLLFVGVGLAVFRAPTNGGQYASIVTMLSGTVISLTSALFFAQANATRKNMGNQAVMLREESQDDRRINTSRELVTSITDESIRNSLQAEIAKSLIANLAPRPSRDSSKGLNASEE